MIFSSYSPRFIRSILDGIDRGCAKPMRPLIDVINICRRGEVGRCLRSVISRTWPTFSEEEIVVQDCMRQMEL